MVVGNKRIQRGGSNNWTIMDKSKLYRVYAMGYGHLAWYNHLVSFVVYFHHVCMQLYIPLKPRSWHIARPVYRPNSTECHVVIFGGNVHVEGDSGHRDNTADLRILSSGMRYILLELYYVWCKKLKSYHGLKPLQCITLKCWEWFAILYYIATSFSANKISHIHFIVLLMHGAVLIIVFFL